MLGTLSQPERLSVEGDPAPRGAVDVVPVRRDEQLGERGHRGTGQRAEHLGPHRHLAPTEDAEALFARDPLDGTLHPVAVVLVEGQVRGADGVLPRCRSSNGTSSRRKASGTWQRMPAPSPVPASDPTAPRCSRLRSAPRAASTMSCPAVPRSVATIASRRRPSRSPGRTSRPRRERPRTGGAGAGATTRCCASGLAGAPWEPSSRGWEQGQRWPGGAFRPDGRDRCPTAPTAGCPVGTGGVEPGSWRAVVGRRSVRALGAACGR